MGNDFFDDLLDPVTVDEGVQEPVEEPVQEEETQPDTVVETDEPTSTEPTTSEDPLYMFLQQRGVKDPSKIVISNEDGSEEEIDFNSLSTEDKIDILTQVTDSGLSENETRAVNFLRQHGNLSLEQALDAYANTYLQQYLNAHPEQIHQRTYEIDDYSDDDLYLIDLKNRYPDFTDEELMSKLESAKSNEELFKKESESLRKYFKDQEDAAVAYQQQTEQKQAEDLRNNLLEASRNFNAVQLDYTDAESDALIIEDEDKRQMLSYILDQDKDGKSQLVRDLENPDTLIELAWLRTKGADVLSDLSKYWKKQLADERATNKKLQAKLDKVGKDTVIVPPADKKKPTADFDLWDKSGLI